MSAPSSTTTGGAAKAKPDARPSDAPERYIAREIHHLLTNPPPVPTANTYAAAAPEPASPSPPQPKPSTPHQTASPNSNEANATTAPSPNATNTTSHSNQKNPKYQVANNRSIHSKEPFVD